MSHNSNRNSYESLGLTKKQFNLNRHLNSDNMKSILYYNDFNIPFHYIQCTKCNCKHLVKPNNYTTNNLMSSILEEKEEEQQQQYKDYSNDKPIFNMECSCNMINLNTMKSNQSGYKAQYTNDSINCCHSYYPLCNYYKEQMNNYRCVHCSCQCCIQSKLTSSMHPLCSSCFYCQKFYE
ncbi:unnamed protein product [Schistosoma spindalis]|nr:unnamed protein product [Schistosoma spindale]